LRGYDEDYGGTYCYDRDLYYRLVAGGAKVTMDPECHPIHLWHVTPSLPNTEQTSREYEEMKKMFASKNFHKAVRNNADTWGEGG